MTSEQLMDPSYWAKINAYLILAFEDFWKNIKNGGWVILAILMVTWICSSLILWAVEDKVKSFWYGLYAAWITMTTVGYGDYSPESITGKVVACIDGLMGLILLGVIIWLAQISLTQDKDKIERRAKKTK